MSKKIIIIVAIVIVIILGSWYVFKKPATAPGPQIDNFKDCANAGYPIMESYPRQCKTPDGRNFTEKIEIDTSDWKIYTNPRYIYTMEYPQDWTVKHEFGPNEILGYGYYELNRFDASSGYALLFAVVPKDSDVMPIPRTGVGAGDFIDSDETVNIGGTEVSIKNLVFQGKVKELFFNAFEINGYEGRAYLSYFGSADYLNLDMTGAEEVEIAKAILESFKLAQPSKIDSFCGTSTNGQCSSDSDCITGGCSGQVCQSKNEEPIITTCEYSDCYNAQAFGLRCVCSNRQCQWKK